MHQLVGLLVADVTAIRHLLMLRHSSISGETSSGRFRQHEVSKHSDASDNAGSFGSSSWFSRVRIDTLLRRKLLTCGQAATATNVNRLKRLVETMG